MAETWNPMQAAPASMPLPKALEVVLDAYGALGPHFCDWCNGSAPENAYGERLESVIHEPGCAVARLLEAVSNV